MPHETYCVLFAGLLLHAPQLATPVTFLKNPKPHATHAWMFPTSGVPMGLSSPGPHGEHVTASVPIPLQRVLTPFPASHLVDPLSVWPSHALHVRVPPPASVKEHVR